MIIRTPSVYWAIDPGEYNSEEDKAPTSAKELHRTIRKQPHKRGGQSMPGKGNASTKALEWEK